MDIKIGYSNKHSGLEKLYAYLVFRLNDTAYKYLPFTGINSGLESNNSWFVDIECNIIVNQNVNEPLCRLQTIERNVFKLFKN